MPRKTACHTIAINSPLTRRLLAFLLLQLVAALGPGFASPPGKTIMIIAPHPDGEALFASGVIDQGTTVKVVLVTNGDALPNPGQALGLARQKETVQAMNRLELRENDVIFLGYPDSYLMDLHNNRTDAPLVTNWGQSVTYGGSGLGNIDYQSYRNKGNPAPYTGSAVINDIKGALTVYQPDEIYTVNHYDDHQDHSAVSLFVKDAIREVMKEHQGTDPQSDAVAANNLLT